MRSDALSCLALSMPVLGAAVGLSVAPEAGGPLDVFSAKPGTYDEIYHLHIPKVAGISFGEDALKILGPKGVEIVSAEGCYSDAEKNARAMATVVILRNPRKHLLSQYRFCKQSFITEYRDAVRPARAPALPGTFEGWIRAWKDLNDREKWRGNLTPPARPVSWSFSERNWRTIRMQRWEHPPFSPNGKVHLRQEDWQRLDGGGTIWHHVYTPFQCYIPVNPQTHRLSCNHPMDVSEVENLDVAIRNVRKAWMVGLVEEYKATMCLMEARISQVFPQGCDCRNTDPVHQYGTSMANVYAHGAEDRISRESADMVDELTASDRKLFRVAAERFLELVRQAEQERGRQILCKDNATFFAGLDLL